MKRLVNILKPVVQNRVLFLTFVFIFIGCSSNQDKAIYESFFNKEILSFVPYTSRYGERELGFQHRYDEPKKALGFIGSAVIDVNNDGVEEFFISGGHNQIDALYFYKNGAFVDLASEYGFSNTTAAYGALSLDFNADSKIDLAVARDDGVYIYWNEGVRFREELIFNNFGTHSSPVDITSADVDKDGDADLYISTFANAANFRSAIFNDPSHATENILLENEGAGSFVDHTKASGLSLNQNTFTSLLIDLNSNGYEDLVVVPNTGRVLLYENIRGHFNLVGPLTEYGFWMGAASGDFNGDGRQDLFISNAGASVPDLLLRGDLRADQTLETNYAFLINQGELQFDNVINKMSPSSHGFGWGIIRADLNIDNLDDFIILQNYINWPIHKLWKLPGSVLIQEKENEYREVHSDSDLTNRAYGMSALVFDANGDGLDDVVFLNLASSARILLNDGTGHSIANNYVRICFVDEVHSFGSVIKVNLKGQSFEKVYNPKQGLMSDQSSCMNLSLGNQDNAEVVVSSNTVPIQKKRFKISEQGAVVSVKWDME